MLRHRKVLPLDYSLCCMTVTVYKQADRSRHVIHNTHFEINDQRSVEMGKARRSRSFLLVIPGAWDIRPGDKVILGEGPEAVGWEQLTGAMEGLVVVGSVKPRYFGGKICHMEARG